MTTNELRDYIDDSLDLIRELEFDLRELRDANRVDEDYKLKWESNKKITKAFFQELVARSLALHDFAYGEESPLR